MKTLRFCPLYDKSIISVDYLPRLLSQTVRQNKEPGNPVENIAMGWRIFQDWIELAVPEKDLVFDRYLSNGVWIYLDTALQPREVVVMYAIGKGEVDLGTISCDPTK